jgi:hypothetical protein
MRSDGVVRLSVGVMTTLLPNREDALLPPTVEEHLRAESVY